MVQYPRTIDAASHHDIIIGRESRLRMSLSRFAVLSCCVMLASLAHGQVSPSSINFLDVVNGTGPGPQTLTITPGGPAVGGPWTAIPITLSGGNWLGVQPQAGTGTSTVIVFAVTTGLPVGTYQGQVLVQIDRKSVV